MIRVLLSATLLASLALTACKAKPEASDPKTASAPAQPAKAAASQPSDEAAMHPKGLSAGDRMAREDDGSVRRGVALSSGEPMTVAQVYAKASDLDKKMVKVEGTVDSVCSKSGCWFVVQDGERNIRITSKGYKFFVPSDVKGHVATIEGELAIKVLSQEEAQHFEDDKNGENAKKVEGAKKEFSIAAVGLEMKKPTDG